MLTGTYTYIIMITGANILHDNKMHSKTLELLVEVRACELNSICKSILVMIFYEMATDFVHIFVVAFTVLHHQLALWKYPII